MRDERSSHGPNTESRRTEPRIARITRMKDNKYSPDAGRFHIFLPLFFCQRLPGSTRRSSVAPAGIRVINVIRGLPCSTFIPHPSSLFPLCFQKQSQSASNRLTHPIFPRIYVGPADPAKVSSGPESLRNGVKPVSKVSVLRLPAAYDDRDGPQFPPAMQTHILTAGSVGDARGRRQRGSPTLLTQKSWQCSTVWFLGAVPRGRLVSLYQISTNSEIPPLATFRLN
jgi:hypothetical protein